MAYRVTNAGTTLSLIDSDHRAIFLKLRIMKRLQKKIEPRQKMMSLDHSKLLDHDTCGEFCRSVSNKLNNVELPNYSDLANAVN